MSGVVRAGGNLADAAGADVEKWEGKQIGRGLQGGENQEPVDEDNFQGVFDWDEEAREGAVVRTSFKSLHCQQKQWEEWSAGGEDLPLLVWISSIIFQAQMVVWQIESSSFIFAWILQGKEEGGRYAGWEADFEEGQKNQSWDFDS